MRLNAVVVGDGPRTFVSSFLHRGLLHYTEMVFATRLPSYICSSTSRISSSTGSTRTDSVLPGHARSFSKILEQVGYNCKVDKRPTPLKLASAVSTNCDVDYVKHHFYAVWNIQQIVLLSFQVLVLVSIAFLGNLLKCVKNRKQATGFLGIYILCRASKIFLLAHILQNVYFFYR